MPTSDLGKEDQTPYIVHSAREIMLYLRAIKHRNELVSISLADYDDTLLTSILHVSDDDGYLILDGAKTDSQNKRIVDAPCAHFEVYLDHIKILFETSSLKLCTYDGRPAFLLGVPERFVRLQRREYYRVTTPISYPVMCHIPQKDDDGKVTTLSLPLLDISCGGVALRDDKKLLDTTIGTEYLNCRLDLQGTIVTVNLCVRNSMEVNTSAQQSRRRVGCEFVRTSNAMLSSVQRYIMRLEREQQSRGLGLR